MFNLSINNTISKSNPCRCAGDDPLGMLTAGYKKQNSFIHTL